MASEILPGWMNHTLPVPRLFLLWQTPVCDDGLLHLEISHLWSPSSSQPSPIWGMHSMPVQTVRLVGIWDNTQLLKTPQGTGRQPPPLFSPLPGQEGMLKPNTAVPKEGELASEPSASRQRASVVGSTKAVLSLASLVISAGHSELHPGCIRKENIFFLHPS